MAKARIKRLVAVTWTPPADGSGQALDPITFHLRAIGMAEGLALAEQQNEPGPRSAAKTNAMLELVVSKVISWDGVDDDDGKPAPCTEEARRAFFDAYPDSLVAVMHGAFPMISAGVAERKNANGGGSDSREPAASSPVM